MYECCICHQHARRTLSALLRHIREVHPHFEGRVLCGVDDCPATPSTYEGLRQHMYRFHKEHITQQCSESSSATTPISNENLPLCDSEEPMAESQGNQESINNEKHDAKVVGAHFILKTRDGRKITQKAVDGIVQDAKILVQNTLQSIERRVFDKMNHLGVELTDGELDELKTVFHDDDTLPFSELHSEHMQEKFIREHFNYVVSDKTCLAL